MTVRRTFLQTLVGPKAYKRIFGPMSSGSARRVEFRPSSNNRLAATSVPRKIRIKKVASRSKPVQEKPTVPKLPPAGPQMLPKPLKAPPPMPPTPATTTAKANSAARKVAGENRNASLQRALDFLKLNGPVLILNFGSLCTLAGFTRTDVLELRIGNLIGNVCGASYFLYNGLFPPLTWASVFGFTNAYNIYLILAERSDKVIMSEEEQHLYAEHFLNHGVTPKQFVMILEKSERVKVPQGQVIIRANSPMTSVFLVIKGRTEASILGRHLTYASSLPGNHVRQKGGDSGAWIGEIAFLEEFWKTEQATLKKRKTFRKPKMLTSDEDEDDDDDDQDYDNFHVRDEHGNYMSNYNNGSRSGRALHTIICTEDATLLRWSHDSLEGLLTTSSDMRSAMTRAMTAAVVGKVVNFTVSRGKESRLHKDGNPTWSAWLGEGTASEKGAKGAIDDTRKAKDGIPVSQSTQKLKDESLPSTAMPRKHSPRPHVSATTDISREAAIEAFRQVLLGQQEMENKAQSAVK